MADAFAPTSDTQVVDKPPSGAGLINSDNASCFLIVALQALCASPVELSDGFVKTFLQQMRDVQQPIQVQPVVDHLRGCSEVARGWAVQGRHGPKPSNDHQDCAEALMVLIEQDEALKQAFHVEQYTKKVCGCGELDTEVPLDPYFVGLPLTKGTVQGCLQDRERSCLMDAQNLHSCGRPITEQVEVRSLSRLLVLQLARAITGEKDNGPCAFDTSISAFGRSGTLYAVLEHDGMWDNGHYRCYLRSGGQWYLYDNVSVLEGTARSQQVAMERCKPVPVDESKVLDAQAYLLFYQLDEVSGGDECEADDDDIDGHGGEGSGSGSGTGSGGGDGGDGGASEGNNAHVNSGAGGGECRTDGCTVGCCQVASNVTATHPPSVPAPMEVDSQQPHAPPTTTLTVQPGPIQTRHVVLGRFAESGALVLVPGDRQSKTCGLMLVRSGAEGSRVLLNAMVELCASYTDPMDPSLNVFMYHEDPERFRRPLLLGETASDAGYFSVLRTNPARTSTINGGVTARIVRGHGWLRAEIVLLRSRKPKSGDRIGSTLIDWVKRLVTEERRDGETVEIVAFALLDARGFFEKMGFRADTGAAQKLMEIYESFDMENDIWNVEWDGGDTVKMLWCLPASSDIGGDDGDGDGGSPSDGGGPHRGPSGDKGGDEGGDTGDAGGAKEGSRTRSGDGPQPPSDAITKFVTSIERDNLVRSSNNRLPTSVSLSVCGLSLLRSGGTWQVGAPLPGVGIYMAIGSHRPLRSRHAKRVGDGTRRGDKKAGHPHPLGHQYPVEDAQARVGSDLSDAAALVAHRAQCWRVRCGVL